MPVETDTNFLTSRTDKDLALTGQVSKLNPVMLNSSDHKNSFIMDFFPRGKVLKLNEWLKDAEDGFT